MEQKSTNSIFFTIAKVLAIFAGGYVSHWWLTRHDVPNAVKKERAKKDKEHAEDLKRFQDQRQTENQMFRSIIDNLINHKNEA